MFYLQRIQTQTRFEDFMVEVDDADFDILLLTETWRSEREEFYKTNDGQNLFLSGSPLGHAGVGICISKALSRDVLDVTFHAYSERLCALHLSFGHRKFQIFACYFPTSWAPDADVEGVYELLNLLLANCRQSGAIPIIGGDFNASIGEAQAGDDGNTFGNSGIGRRNARGQLLMQWVLENGLLVQNRLDHKLLGEDSWTCCRTFDSSLVQIDFIFTSPKLIIMDSWCDFSIPIGLDHRCVHCVLQLVSPPKKRKQQKWNFKFWQPTLNDNGRPAAFQENIRSLIRSSSPSTFHELEVVLTQAGIQHGKIDRPGMPFRPSMHLRQLRHRRRTSNSQEARKNLSLRIRKVYRCELRSWKSRQLGLYLGNASMWKTLRTQLPKPSGQQCTQQPTSEEFASMLEGLFVGPLAIVHDAPTVLEQPWTLEELRLAIKRLKLKKSPDETGLTAELLKAVPEEFLVQTLAAFNVILESGRIPDTWKLTTFRMLPKKLRAIQTTDFRPIASSGFSTRYLGT